MDGLLGIAMVITSDYGSFPKIPYLLSTSKKIQEYPINIPVNPTKSCWISSSSLLNPSLNDILGFLCDSSERWCSRSHLEGPMPEGTGLSKTNTMVLA